LWWRPSRTACYFVHLFMYFYSIESVCAYEREQLTIEGLKICYELGVGKAGEVNWHTTQHTGPCTWSYSSRCLVSAIL